MDHEPQDVRLLPWRIPNWLVDGFLIVVIAITLLEAAGPTQLISAAAAVGVVFARRRFPIPCVVAAIVLSGIFVGTVGGPSSMAIALLAALYTVGVSYPWRVTVIVGLLASASFGMVVYLRLGESLQREGASLAAIAWPAFVVAVGATVRASRENLANANDRADRAEATREIEAERRVVEERLRIARDVHDLVAHHMAVVNVQSGVAQHLMATNTNAAAEALETARTSASTAISELGQLLSVLRSTDEGNAIDQPTPDLAAIDDLVSSFGASGLRIERTTTGTPRPLAPSTETAAYRFMQEALTNAHRYGSGSVTVEQTFDDDGLQISVTNAKGASTSHGSGFGLIGMRERIEVAGGTLVVDDDAARFRVRALLPCLETQ